MNPETAAVAERLLEEGILSTLDVRFGRLILRLAGSGGLPLFLAAALTRRAVGRGHVCLDLAEIGKQRLMEGEGGFLERVCPDADSLRKTLMQNPMVGDGSGIAPLVLDSAGRLYLHRLWECETFLARALLHRAGRFVPPADLLGIKAAVDLLFPRPHGGLPDPQAAAAYLAATGRFCIISGGPGTGKTTTAGKLLALLVSLQMQPIRIALAAPTGKAAARLKESIRWVKGSLSVGEAVKSVIPEEAATLHRLLGSTPGKAGFRYTPENPLPVDWVLVDEASMVDLTLMAGLFRAVPSHAGIVLLGDRDQLASVETGTVFGDVCSRERSPGIAPEVARGLEATFGLEKGSVLTRAAGKKGLSDCIVTLDTPHRFSAASGIARLSQAVRDGDADGTLDLLRSGGFGDVQWIFETGSKRYETVLGEAILRGYASCLTAVNAEAALEEIKRFRILCAVNRGPFGVMDVNAFAERRLRSKGLIDSGAARLASGYRGLPILITQNLYTLNLFNGDTGLLWFAPGKGLVAVFPGLQGPSKTLAVSRLPHFETAYAMTVHKSQGSEFDEVLLILPERDLPILTRELLYTGITRARRRLVLWASEEVIRQAVSRRIERSSGLRDALWGPGNA